MCGIAGFSGDFRESLIDSMNRSIAHRGPDDAGVYFNAEKGIGLGHRRLSIIDLSSLGHQPMWDFSLTAVIVFNGEIYNYRELRGDLIDAGFQFRSNSDTEVLLNLYLKEGREMLSRLNGIFSFALYDTRDGSLFIARDGVGVKPLYYARTPKGFLFASEIKALLQEPSVDRTMNPAAIRNYLTYLWSPAPDTMLKAVRKLEPGHAMIIKDAKIEKSWQFFELPYSQDIESAGVEQTVPDVQSRVEQAVKRQMVADVPVGAFLSGGLDSSAVITFARKFSDSPIQCFTIGFKDTASRCEGMTDDLPYAQKVAKHLGVDLHTIYVGSSDMAAQLSHMIYHLDEPQADPAPINVWFISKLARENGIKVLLSGAGGDDIFGGYRRHYALTQERLWAWLPRSARRIMSVAATSLPVASSSLRRLSKAFQYAHWENDERLAGYFHWLDPRSVSRLYSDDFIKAAEAEDMRDPLLRSLANISSDMPRLNRMLYLECKHFLADHNLAYTDKMSMACGVEVRVPLLDPDLMALAARLPVSFKQHGKTGKWIFKKAMEPFLPHDVVYRPKTGFGAPLRHWLKHELREMKEDILSGHSLKKRGLFNPGMVRGLIDRDAKGKVDGTYALFSLICIEMWCRIFLDGEVPAV